MFLNSHVKKIFLWINFLDPRVGGLKEQLSVAPLLLVFCIIFLSNNFESKFCKIKNPAFSGINNSFAERGGFEPPVPCYMVRRFSKPVVSATHPPLRE